MWHLSRNSWVVNRRIIKFSNSPTNVKRKHHGILLSTLNATNDLACYIKAMNVRQFIWVVCELHQQFQCVRVEFPKYVVCCLRYYKRVFVTVPNLICVADYWNCLTCYFLLLSVVVGVYWTTRRTMAIRVCYCFI